VDFYRLLHILNLINHALLHDDMGRIASGTGHTLDRKRQILPHDDAQHCQDTVLQCKKTPQGRQFLPHSGTLPDKMAACAGNGNKNMHLLTFLNIG